MNKTEKRIDKFVTVIVQNDEKKTIKLQGYKSHNNFMKYCKKYNVTVLSDSKLYPFSQVRYKDTFRIVSENAAAAINNMITGKETFDEEKLKLIESYKQRADKYLKFELPVAWLTSEEYGEVQQFLKEVTQS